MPPKVSGKVIKVTSFHVGEVTVLKSTLNADSAGPAQAKKWLLSRYQRPRSPAPTQTLITVRICLQAADGRRHLRQWLDSPDASAVKGIVEAEIARVDAGSIGPDSEQPTDPVVVGWFPANAEFSTATEFFLIEAYLPSSIRATSFLPESFTLLEPLPQSRSSVSCLMTDTPTAMVVIVQELLGERGPVPCLKAQARRLPEGFADPVYKTLCRVFRKSYRNPGDFAKTVREIKDELDKALRQGQTRQVGIAAGDGRDGGGGKATTGAGALAARAATPRPPTGTGGADGDATRRDGPATAGTGVGGGAPPLPPGPPAGGGAMADAGVGGGAPSFTRGQTPVLPVSARLPVVSAAAKNMSERSDFYQQERVARWTLDNDFDAACDALSSWHHTSICAIIDASLCDACRVHKNGGATAAACTCGRNPAPASTAADAGSGVAVSSGRDGGDASPRASPNPQLHATGGGGTGSGGRGGPDAPADASPGASPPTPPSRTATKKRRRDDIPSIALPLLRSLAKGHDPLLEDCCESCHYARAVLHLQACPAPADLIEEFTTALRAEEAAQPRDDEVRLLPTNLTDCDWTEEQQSAVVSRLSEKGQGILSDMKDTVQVDWQESRGVCFPEQKRGKTIIPALGPTMDFYGDPPVLPRLPVCGDSRLIPESLQHNIRLHIFEQPIGVTSADAGIPPEQPDALPADVDWKDPKLFLRASHRTARVTEANGTEWNIPPGAVYMLATRMQHERSPSGRQFLAWPLHIHVAAPQMQSATRLRSAPFDIVVGAVDACSTTTSERAKIRHGLADATRIATADDADATSTAQDAPADGDTATADGTASTTTSSSSGPFFYRDLGVCDPPGYWACGLRGLMVSRTHDGWAPYAVMTPGETWWKCFRAKDSRPAAASEDGSSDVQSAAAPDVLSKAGSMRSAPADTKSKSHAAAGPASTESKSHVPAENLPGDGKPPSGICVIQNRVGNHILVVTEPNEEGNVDGYRIEPSREVKVKPTGLVAQNTFLDPPQAGVRRAIYKASAPVVLRNPAPALVRWVEAKVNAENDRTKAGAGGSRGGDADSGGGGGGGIRAGHDSGGSGGGRGRSGRGGAGDAPAGGGRSGDGDAAASSSGGGAAVVTTAAVAAVTAVMAPLSDAAVSLSEAAKSLAAQRLQPIPPTPPPPPQPAPPPAAPDFFAAPAPGAKSYAKLLEEAAYARGRVDQGTDIAEHLHRDRDREHQTKRTEAVAGAADSGVAKAAAGVACPQPPGPCGCGWTKIRMALNHPALSVCPPEKRSIDDHPPGQPS